MLAVTDFFRTMLALFPRDLRSEVESCLPALGRAARRLADEVFEAESQGLTYIEAIEHPTFPLMARVHHGVLDTLQWRFPPRALEGLRLVCRSAARGEFDPFRRLLFVVAGRKDDPDAALARFLIFQAVRLNMYLWTWKKPEVEASGCLTSIEEDAQKLLDDFLACPDVAAEDVRPLNVLVAEVLVHLGRKVTAKARLLREHVGDVIREMIDDTEALRMVRALPAADAAVFRPGRSPEPLGAQRIADRYPWHFPSANAVDQRRSRLRKRLDPDSSPVASGDRLVDLLLSELEGEEG